MDNLQLQHAYSVEVPRPPAAADSHQDSSEDDSILHFCLDGGGGEGGQGLLYAVTAAGRVLCLEQHGRKVWGGGLCGLLCVLLLPATHSTQHTRPTRPHTRHRSCSGACRCRSSCHTSSSSSRGW